MIQERKKVLFLVPAFVGGAGGAERVITTVLRHLDHSRFECHLALVLAGRVFLESLPVDVIVHNLGVVRMRYALPRIIKLVWKVRPQTILSTVSYLNVMLVLARPFLPSGICLLIREATTPSAFIAKDVGNPRLWNWFYRRLYPRADKVICLSDSMQRDLVEHFFLPSAKLVRIYNPVDMATVRCQAELGETPYSAPGPHIVAVGRLRREKGFDVLLQAFAGVLKSAPGARLAILGEGPLEHQLKAQAISLGIDNAVSFLGFQANPWPYVKHADLFVLASRYEGLPNAVLEVLALGTPIVATDCPGGIREIQKSAPQIVLVAPENAPALTDAIVSALSRPEETNRRAIEAEECLRRFDIQQIVDEYTRLL
ncbi:MAG TPA: glycosyltransferase [Verrucomicrobiae bacterium]|nr:glycosyltransferase [Verrucomicrobiae bacterium]